MEAVKTRRDVQPSYEGDFFAWSRDQGRRLRETRPKSIDWENVAEETECLGRSQKRSIETYLGGVLRHLLGWQYRPDRRGMSYRAAIAEHRKRIRREVKDSPSLRDYLGEVLADAYENVRHGVSGETDFVESILPALCPYTIGQILNPDYWPDPLEE